MNYIFLFPLVSLAFEYLSKRITVYAFLATLVFLIPIFIGYSYIFSAINLGVWIVGLGTGYSLFAKWIMEKEIARIVSATLISVFLFVIFGLSALLHSISGTAIVVQHWELEGYKVEYMKDRGYAGKALMKYRLTDYALIPLFMKNEITEERDTTYECEIPFKKSSVTFDKCKRSIQKLNDI